MDRQYQGRLDDVDVKQYTVQLAVTCCSLISSTDMTGYFKIRKLFGGNVFCCFYVDQ